MAGIDVGGVDVNIKTSIENINFDEGDLELKGRLRTKTEKGQALYEDIVQKYVLKIDSIWFEVEDITMKVSDYASQSDFKALRNLDKNLQMLQAKHKRESEDFLGFLTRTNTAESISELGVQEILHTKCQKIMKDLRRKIMEARIEATEQLSQRGSHRSPSIQTISEVGETSEMDSILIRKRMEVEAQRAKVSFEARESRLRKERASLVEREAKHEAEGARRREELDAEFLLLEQERKLAIAEAEVKALEKSQSGSGSRDSSPGPSLLEAPLDRSQLTARYVNESYQRNDVIDAEVRENPETEFPAEHLDPNVQNSNLNPNAAVFKTNRTHTDSVVGDLTKFLLKKDLLLSRFYKFNDRPEVFATWKTSFLSITQELGVTPFEEVDLLLKYLGPESTKFASSIRTANVAYPERGLRRIWERLDERYGSPELVESALKAKLERFPRLMPKDSKQLYDLADILAEIEAARETPKYTTLLSYFDSSSGILPIINKLPYNLQEKWTTQASNYKKNHNVSYPPFTFLVQFLQDMSRIRNDPGFQYEVQSKPKNKQSSSSSLNGSSAKDRDSVRTNKTEIETKREKDAPQTCIIHSNIQPPHSLKDCRVFRSKSIANRKKILKDEGICFRCCNAKHMARDCKVTLKCQLCSSTEHCTPLHPNDTKSNHPYKEHGGEKLVTSSIANSTSENVGSPVSTFCVQICGKRFTGKSCAKMLLVRVYRSGMQETAVNMYALVDDQSNRSLARSEFFDLLNVNTEPKNYTISSCSGTIPICGRQVDGLIIESWDSTQTITLPTITECDNIPCNRDEIATPEIAKHYSHLVDIASEIPPLNEAPVLLLLGRDALEVHHVLDTK